MFPFPYRNHRCVYPKTNTAHCKFFLFCSVLLCWFLWGYGTPHHIIIHFFYCITFSSMLPSPLRIFLFLALEDNADGMPDIICRSTYSYNEIKIWQGIYHREATSEEKTSTWHCTGTSCLRPVRCLLTKLWWQDIVCLIHTDEMCLVVEDSFIYQKRLWAALL